MRKLIISLVTLILIILFCFAVLIGCKAGSQIVTGGTEVNATESIAAITDSSINSQASESEPLSDEELLALKGETTGQSQTTVTNEKSAEEILKEDEKLKEEAIAKEKEAADQTAAEESAAEETITIDIASTGMTVIGSEDFKNKTNLAFSLLYYKARNYYDMVLQYIGVIKYVDKGSCIDIYKEPPVFLVGKATVDAGTIWYAGALVHEATHSKCLHDYEAAHPGESVPDDVHSGENGEAIAVNVQYDALSKIGADQATLDYVKNLLDSKWWEIPFEDRWW